MQRINKLISRYWLFVVIGCVLEKLAIGVAYAERGRVAYGGEYLVLPVVLIVAVMIYEVIDFVNEVNEGGNVDVQ